MGVEVRVVEDGYAITFPYDPQLVAGVKALPKRKWDKDNKQWIVGESAVMELADWLGKIGVPIPDVLRKGVADTQTRIEQSSAQTGNMVIPSPEGLSYLPYQKAGIAFVSGREGTLLADDMGLGKTMQAIGVVQVDPTIKSVLIICPASLKLNWKREFEKWDTRGLTVEVANGTFPTSDVVIINYDILRKHDSAIHQRAWDLLVVDEAHMCFPAGTLVETSDGPLPIERIVQYRMKVSVASMDLSRHVVEYKRVTGWVSLPAYTPLVKVTHEHGAFICTADHRIWADRGYVEAHALTSGTNLSLLWGEVYGPDQGEEYRQILRSSLCREMEQRHSRAEGVGAGAVREATRSQAVSTVREGVFLSQQGRVEEQRASLLWEPVRSALAYTATVVREGCSSYESPSCVEQRLKGPRSLCADEGAKPHEQPRDREEDAAVPFRENVSIEGRKGLSYCTSETTGISDGVPYGAHDSYNPRKGPVPFPPPILSGGSGGPLPYVGYRSGRKDAPPTQVAVSRQTKDGSITGSRVVSVEVLERGSNAGDGEGTSRNQLVYCLEVADNHNFFADGVLVANCKNPKAMRTKQILGYYDSEIRKRIPGIDARKRLFMTGTPILNRPIEAWPLVHALAPSEFPSWKHYTTRYCNAYDDGYGSDVSGASNLDELQRRLRASCMLRRRKVDVLTELPDKRRQLITIQPTGEMLAAVKEEQLAMETRKQRLDALAVLAELAKADSEDAFREASRRLSEAASVAFTEISKERHRVAVAKVPAVLEHVKDMVEEQDLKVILFAHHRDVIQALSAPFGRSAVVLTGETSLQERQAAVDRFQNDPSCKLFVGNILAAGVGITLTASSHVVFAELDWRPGMMTQAEDRAHRIGQKDNVSVQHIVLDGSLDAQMAKTILEKQEIIDQALDKDATFELRESSVAPEHQPPATKTITAKEIKVAATLIEPEVVTAVHLALRMLRAMCDGASSVDGMGFNKIDTGIGKSLASASDLTPRQAVLGQRIVRRYYKRQLADQFTREQLGI